MTSGFFRWLVAAPLLFMIATGCSQQTELAYTPREELKDAPAKHQQQIAAALEKYFGTPRFPKFMELAPEGKQPADAKEPLLIEKYAAAHLRQGREVYARQCSGCHGTTGDGKPAARATRHRVISLGDSSSEHAARVQTAPRGSGSHPSLRSEGHQHANVSVDSAGRSGSGD
jgi:mono/diheme cytochrome c family protein